MVEEWLFKNVTNSLRADLDVRSGGKFFILESDGGTVIDHIGEYFEVRRPTRLSFTLESSSLSQGPSRIELDFQNVTGGTEMHFIQTGLESGQAEAAWRASFQNLTRLLLRE